ncbi:MAG: hypothetical protein OXG88_03870, partial [Gammaproteobacteria bacterium]|nr:hypothetical protein [Gammaproteobacteria bacterium]
MRFTLVTSLQIKYRTSAGAIDFRKPNTHGYLERSVSVGLGRARITEYTWPRHIFPALSGDTAYSADSKVNVDSPRRHYQIMEVIVQQERLTAKIVSLCLVWRDKIY